MAQPSRPELLAPAGDWEALRAAAANGADAVYFGLPQFNARHRATNFQPDELPKILAFLHDRNVRAFVTLNTLIFSEELPAVAEYVKSIADAGADAVIVQDLGLATLIRRLVPDLHVHASTQMTLSEPRSIAFAQRELGVRRVVLPRELSVAEVRRISENSTTELEVFVHGALCVSYSGQCLTSEAIGGRSANRGQCAQACRLPYEMVVDGTVRELGDRAYLLSPQDLAAHEYIAPLTEAGVVSFKIEGRLKSGPYVAAATQTYRAAIDAAAKRQPFQLSKREERELAQSFSRGFTPGFLEGPNHQRLVHGRFPKSRGVMIGNVIGASRRGMWIELIAADHTLVKPGDGVVFDLGRPEEKEPGGRVWEVGFDKAHPNRAELLFEPGAIDANDVPVGARVWKTDDPALRRRLEQTYVNDRPLRRAPIRVHATGRVGAALRITVTDERGHQSVAEWPGPLQAAAKHPLTVDSLREQFDRLGDTPFELEEVTLDIPEAVMAPRSVVNDLRRQAIAALQKSRATEMRSAIAEPDALAVMRSAVAARARGTESNVYSRAALIALARNLDQLEAALAWRSHDESRLAMVYCEFEDVRRYREAVSRARNAGIPIGLATLRIMKPGEEGLLKPLINAEPDALLIRNLGALELCRADAPSLSLIGDFSLNVANELTADLLIRSGLSRLVPSYDLNWEQLVGMVQRCHAAWFEPVIHQHMPMFHNEHCVFAALLSNGKDWRDCGRPCDHHRVELRDRVGASFPVIADAGCRNTVFNSVAQSAAEYLGRMQDLGLRRFRVDLLRETPDEVGPLLDRYARVLAGLEDGRATWRSLQVLNQLGVTRGTLQMT